MVGAMKGMKIYRPCGGLGASGRRHRRFGAGRRSRQEPPRRIGIIPKEKAPIIYNERAPLVLPPKMDLRLRAAGGGAEARNGNWPKDPDVAARRKAAAEARTPYTSSELYKNTEASRLSIEEMRAGRNPNNHVDDRPGHGRTVRPKQPHDARRAALLLQG